METITFDTELAAALEARICGVFNCSVAEIVGMRYTLAKKVIVFIFSDYYGYTNRVIGHKYQLSHLYVPTVVREIKYQFKVDSGLRNKIESIVKKVAYEKNLDQIGNKHSTRDISA
jgi:hypothetical protein